MVNGIFSGAEIAVLSMRKTRVRELIEKGHGKARAVHALRDRPERFLATVQIGITIVSAAAATFGGGAFREHVATPLVRWGMSASAASTLSFVIVVGAISYLSLVLGELVPKSLALRYAEGYSMLVAKPLLGLSWLMRPFVWFFTASSNLLLRLFKDQTTFTEARLSPDELQQMVEEAAKSGSLDPRVGEIASRAFDFSALIVGDVMLPRSKVVALRRRAPLEEVQRVILEEGHSRMPVYDGTLDNIVGYIIAKDVLALAWEQKLIVLEDILRPAYMVPANKRAVDVLSELQRLRCQMAIVLSEQGSVAGLVTVEDLVEELVGEILSEHEVPEDLIRKEAGGSAVVQGQAPIREVNRAMELNLPEEEDASTIAGLCIVLAGWIPSTGDKLKTGDGTVLEVVDASPRRVRLVRVHKPKVRPGSEPSGPSAGG